MTRMRIAAVAATGIALALAGTAALAEGPADEPAPPTPVVITPDAYEFRNSCASCHGSDGKGAGFLTRLFRGVDPGDLTRLAAQNGGSFPVERVFSVIDGRQEVAAHGARKMPVWGDRYMSAALTQWGPDHVNDLRVRQRIYALVHYLQSIQEPADEG